MLIALALATVQLAAAAPVVGPLAAWRFSGKYVDEQTIYDAQCAASLDDLCRALGVEQEGFLLLASGELRYRGDGECWDLTFRAERVDGDRAEGTFEGAGGEFVDRPEPCAGPACDQRRVQVWREKDTIVLRGDLARLGACQLGERPETTIRRFVPLSRLTKTAGAEARRLGVDLKECSYKTLRGAGAPRRCGSAGAVHP